MMSMTDSQQIGLIVGLGNPGKKYEGTRHNAGFMVIDRLLTKLPGKYLEEDKFSSIFWKGRFRGQRLLLQKPLTFMNASGKSIAAICRKYQVSPEELLVVYDDMDLPLGRLRLRREGTSGGHNGVESIVNELGSSAFPRLRIGIGRNSEIGEVDHVLAEFSDDERKLFEKVTISAVEAIKLVLSRGVEKAMNEFNGNLIELEKEAD